MQTKVDFNKIISNLDKVNKDKYSFHVYSPSLQTDIPFTQITTSQQKTLIKSIIDSQIYNTEFVFAAYEIIKNNCLDNNIKIDQLTLLDKLIILLNLRSKSISNKYTFELTRNNVNFKHEIDIDSLIEKAGDIVLPPSVTISADDYTLTTRAPTVGVEYRIEREIRSKNKNRKDADVKTPDDLRSMVGEAFITELVKYIETIEVAVDDTSMVISFDNLSCEEGIKILERVPIRVMDGVLKYAEEYNNAISSVLKIQIPYIDPETEKPALQDQEITVNGNFFIVS
jgi:hypothetical protein